MGQPNTKSIKEAEKFSKKFKRISINKIKDDNGLVLQGKLIPEKLLAKILENLDFSTLITCRLVCKQWYLLIRDIVIQKKIESIWHNPPVDEPALWKYFEAIWGPFIPYGEDLIKFNHARWITCEWGVSVGSWKNIHDMGEYNNHYMRVDDVCWKQQDIDLNEWFPQYILDNIKPTMIKIWDFYMCEKGKCGKYEFKVEFIKSEESTLGRKDVIIDSTSFSRTFEKDYDPGIWYKVKREFIIYEKGFNKIKFYHDFKNGVRVGGSTVIVQFPCRRKLKKFKPFKIDILGRRLNTPSSERST